MIDKSRRYYRAVYEINEDGVLTTVALCTRSCRRTAITDLLRAAQLRDTCDARIQTIVVDQPDSGSFPDQTIWA